MVQEQFAHAAVVVAEDVLAGGHVDHALVQVHGTAWLAGHGLGHEGGGHIVLERGLAHGALEHQDLVGQVQGVAVTEVDFHLRRAVFVDQRVEVQLLQFAPVVDVFEQRVEFVGGFDRERLTAGFRAARTAYRGLQREVRVFAALGQVELHLRRDDRLPALVGVKLEDFLQHVARRQFDRVALLVVGVVDHLGGRFDGPGHEEHRVLVGAADHVDVGRVEQFVIDVVVDVVAGHGLQQHALGQAHAFFGDEFVGRRNLAARDAGQVTDHAFDFGDLVLFQPIGELVEVVTHKYLRR
ncbi:hypothetical protein D3C79_786300 [compost metagenome]